MGTKINIGLGSIIGTVGAAAGVIIPLIGQLSDAAEPLGVPGSVWVIAGAILGVAVVLGRMAQAVANIVSPPPDTVDFLIDELPDQPTDQPLDA